MRWEERRGIRWLAADLPGTQAVFSTRSAGSIKESRALLAAALGISADSIVSGRQVHGCELAFHTTPSAATHAAIGPGIGPCCYEVGDEVLDEFDRLGDGIASGRMLDLPELARRPLREAGVARVESADLCTRCEAELFFSHRRDGGPGRQAGLVWLEQEAG